jgi:hypothetical protein
VVEFVLSKEDVDERRAVDEARLSDVDDRVESSEDSSVAESRESSILVGVDDEDSLMEEA